MDLLYRDFSDYNQWSAVLVNLIISDDQIWNLSQPQTLQICSSSTLAWDGNLWGNSRQV